MDNEVSSFDIEQEWQWCLVGNIVEKHEYGEEHIIKRGNKQFRPNSKALFIDNKSRLFLKRFVR